MNLTFNQFLEQRDPELYNQMINEGMIGDMAAGIGRMAKFAYKKLGAAAGTTYEFLKNNFTTDGLVSKADENAKEVSKMFARIAELNKMPFHLQKPEEIEKLKEQIKQKIAESKMMLTAAKEDKIFREENPEVINGVSKTWLKALRYAASLGVLSIAMIGLWNTQAIQDNKFDDTYKGDTSGYVAKPSAAAETPTPEAEPTAEPTVQSQGGKLPHLLGKDVEDRGPLGKAAWRLTHPLGGKLAAKMADLRSDKDHKILSGGILKNMRDRAEARKEAGGKGLLGFRGSRR